MPELAGKRALVTGSSRGIGREIARTFAAAGAEVVLVGRHRDVLDAVAADIRAAGGAAHSALCDLTDRAAVQVVASAVGPTDVPVNNAAPEEKFVPIVEPDDPHWDRTLVVNFAPLMLTRELGPGMAANVGGSIEKPPTRS